MVKACLTLLGVGRHPGGGGVVTGGGEGPQEFGEKKGIKIVKNGFPVL